MKYSMSVVGSAFLALALVACGSSANTSNAMGGLRATVQFGGVDAGALSAKSGSKALSADSRKIFSSPDMSNFAIADVTKVTVSITSSDTAAPAIAPIVLTGATGSYTGTFPELRASASGGPTYALSATATGTRDGVADVLLYQGAASGVIVTAGSTTTVFIIANSTAAVVVTDVVPVRITAVQANETARSGEVLNFKVTRNVDATGTVVVAWTQLGRDNTAFGAAALETTTWTAPVTPIALTETISVSLSNGVAAPSTFSFSVSVTAQPGAAAVDVSLNDPPVIASMSLGAPLIAPSSAVIVTVNATDTTDAIADTLSYTFSKGTCTGAFNVEGSAQADNAATFTADAQAPIGVCKLQVVVTDSSGSQAEGAVTLAVDPAAPRFYSTVFNGFPAVLPFNVPSQPFQAQQTFEFGDLIQLAGTARHAAFATVMMSNWALRSEYPATVGNDTGFQHPITLNIYSVVDPSAATPTLGALIATKTQTFTIPWRPEATTASCGTAWRAPDGECYNGQVSTITFDLRDITPLLLLPETFIYGIAYDTQTYGISPKGVTGPYDSLNVGAVGTPRPFVGTDVNPDGVFWNTNTASYYADYVIDSPSNVFGTFRQDTGWTGYSPVVQFQAY